MISIRAQLQKCFTRQVLRRCLSAAQPLQQQRRWLDRLGRLTPLPWGTQIESCDIDGIPAEWVSVGQTDKQPVLLYLHGGGYCIGSSRSHRNIAARLARGLGCRALLPDYRRAPEHPFPAPLQDVLRVYRALLARGIPASQIVLAGDSAGGGLALASCMLLRQLGIELPRAILCISPWVDLSQSGTALQALADLDPMVSHDWIECLAGHYARDEERRHPLISPLFGNFDKFPPVLLQLGGDEILRGQVEQLHRRMCHAGVDSQLQLAAGMWHVWPLFGGLMPEADSAIRDAVAFLRQQLGLQQQPAGVPQAAAA